MYLWIIIEREEELYRENRKLQRNLSETSNDEIIIFSQWRLNYTSNSEAWGWKQISSTQFVEHFLNEHEIYIAAQSLNSKSIKINEFPFWSDNKSQKFKETHHDPIRGKVCGRIFLEFTWSFKNLFY